MLKKLQLKYSRVWDSSLDDSKIVDTLPLQYPQILFVSFNTDKILVF